MGFSIISFLILKNIFLDDSIYTEKVTHDDRSQLNDSIKPNMYTSICP